MVEDTIQVIRETEAKAAGIMAQAEAESRSILEDARMQAEQLIGGTRSDCRRESEREMERARTDGVLFQENAASSIAMDVQALRELAGRREEEAVNLVISSLI